MNGFKVYLELLLLVLGSKVLSKEKLESPLGLVGGQVQCNH